MLLAAALDPLLAGASRGLRQALRLHQESVIGDLGALFNVLADVLLEAMLQHPRFGSDGLAGLVVAAPLLALNLFTFPTPAAELALIDVGPVSGRLSRGE